MLIKGQLASELYAFMKDANSNVIEDPDKAMKLYADKLEELIYDAIRSIAITIPPGTIQVVAPPPSGVGSNVNPVNISGTIK